MRPEDKALFKEAMAGVKPLKGSDKVTHAKKPPEKTPKRRIEPEVSFTALSDPLDNAFVYAEDNLSFGNHKVQSRQFKSLKQGKLAIEARLDLHHHTLSQARDKLPPFIHKAHEAGKRVVLIIHGKGGYNNAPSQMKSYVNHWLKQLPEVLAFHSTIPKDGGRGSVYVLLKG